MLCPKGPLHDSSGPTLVPARALQVFLRGLAGAAEVVAYRADRLRRFVAGRWEVVTPMAETRFPPYLQVLPPATAARVRVVMDRVQVQQALTQLPRLPARDRERVRLRVNGQVFLERDGPAGLASVPIPTVSAHIGSSSRRPSEWMGTSWG